MTDEIYVTPLSPHSNITKANRLIEAKYSLTLNEQKIIYAITSAVRFGDSDFEDVIFRVKQLADFCSISSTNSYNEIKKVTSTLLTRVLQFYENEDLIQTHWVQRARYSKGGGYVTFTLDPTLKPFLLELKEAFTSIKVQELMTFKSSYTGRLYELLLQYKNLGERIFDVEKFKDILCLKENKSYNLFSNIKNRVIEPAINEINLNTIWDVSCEYQSAKGKKITTLVFKIKIKESMKKFDKNFKQASKGFYELDTLSDEEMLEYKLTKVGLEKEFDYYKNCLMQKKYSVERIIKNLDYSLSKSKNIKNLTAYVKTAIEQDFASVDNQSLFSNIKNREEEILGLKERLNTLQKYKYNLQNSGLSDIEVEQGLKEWYKRIYNEDYTEYTEIEIIKKLP